MSTSFGASSIFWFLRRGLLRRAMGKDTLRLRDFKKGQGSVFHTRSGPFAPADLKTPF